jgi:hypothetical protein
VRYAEPPRRLPLRYAARYQTTSFLLQPFRRASGSDVRRRCGKPLTDPLRDRVARYGGVRFEAGAQNGTHFSAHSSEQHSSSLNHIGLPHSPHEWRTNALLRRHHHHGAKIHSSDPHCTKSDS